MSDKEDILEAEDHTEPQEEARAEGDRFTLEDLMALTYPERLAVADESGLEGEDLEKAKAPPPDPDADLLPQPEAEKPASTDDGEGEPEEKGESAEATVEEPPTEEPPPAVGEDAPAPQGQKQEQMPSPAPEPEPEPDVPDTSSMQARLDEIQRERETLLASFEEMDIEPDAFREQDAALIEEMVGLRAEIVAADRAAEVQAAAQKASDDAWYAAVGKAMEAAEIPAEGDRALAFDVILRRYEEMRPDLADGAKIASAVDALAAIERAQIGPEIFPGFEAMLRTIEVRQRDIPEGEKISLAVKAFAAAQEAVGTPLSGEMPGPEVKPEPKDGGRPERPGAPVTLSQVPADGMSGMTDGGQVAAIVAQINSGRLDPREAERLMASIPENQWVSETRRMPGNDYAGYER